MGIDREAGDNLRPSLWVAHFLVNARHHVTSLSIGALIRGAVHPREATAGTVRRTTTHVTSITITKSKTQPHGVETEIVHSCTFRFSAASAAPR